MEQYDIKYKGKSMLEEMKRITPEDAEKYLDARRVPTWKWDSEKRKKIMTGMSYIKNGINYHALAVPRNEIEVKSEDILFGDEKEPVTTKPKKKKEVHPMIKAQQTAFSNKQFIGDTSGKLVNV